MKVIAIDTLFYTFSYEHVNIGLSECVGMRRVHAPLSQQKDSGYDFYFFLFFDIPTCRKKKKKKNGDVQLYRYLRFTVTDTA